GPEFKVRHEYYQTKERKSDGYTAPFKLGPISKIEIPGFEGGLGHNNAYSDNFFAFTQDFNKDGWDDILIYGFPGKDASWYENPKGKKSEDGTEHWKRHKVLDIVDNESPGWADITGDGKKEIVCNSEGYFGYAEPDWNNPTQPWKFKPVTPKS